MNLNCYALVKGKRTPATIGLIQTSTAVTFNLLKTGNTLSIARAYLRWVMDKFPTDIYGDVHAAECTKLKCVLDNPESFEFWHC